MADRFYQAARRLVVPLGLLGPDHGTAIRNIATALRREDSRSRDQIPALAGHPRHLFELIAASPPLQTLLLVGAQNTHPTRTRGVHLGDPLFSQWKLAEQDGWALRIHCFHRDDPDIPHNHGWEWQSLILSCGYFDVGADGQRAWRAPGERIVDDGSRFHKVELQDGVPAWTLFLHGPEVRQWGFLGEDGAIIERDKLVSRRGAPA